MNKDARIVELSSKVTELEKQVQDLKAELSIAWEDDPLVEQLRSELAVAHEWLDKNKADGLRLRAENEQLKRDKEALLESNKGLATMVEDAERRLSKWSKSLGQSYGESADKLQSLKDRLFTILNGRHTFGKMVKLCRKELNK